MRVWLPRAEEVDDYESVRRNGLWYLPDQSGYGDIVKRGIPRPEDPRVVLAELYSPRVPDFLHDRLSGVPFLVTDRVRALFERNGFTGCEFAPVVVAKVACKGTQPPRAHGGEPGDAIWKARGVTGVAVPTLHAVHVAGFVDVWIPELSPDHPPYAHRPFEIIAQTTYPDLWKPRHEGAVRSKRSFCSDRFRKLCLAEGLTNIIFEPVDVSVRE